MTCSVEGCEREGGLSRGMCRAHYKRFMRTGSAGGSVVAAQNRPQPARGVCAVAECGARHLAGGYCSKHYERAFKHGDPAVVRRWWDAATRGYFAVHQALTRERGPASGYWCDSCDSRAAQWAYDHADPSEQTQNVRGDDFPYSQDFEHYVPMCRSCHVIFDHAQKQVV